MKGIISAIVREGLLDEEGIARLKDLVASGRPLDDALREADGVPEDVLLRFLAKEMLVPYIELENVLLELSAVTDPAKTRSSLQTLDKYVVLPHCVRTRIFGIRERARKNGICANPVHTPERGDVACEAEERSL